ncbi:MAG: helix-turn-helix transcriptional regulator [Eubacteriales bacterium]|nr:helix-turn-helix transcriptional regulator [Eubacteriales bacterium]
MEEILRMQENLLLIRRTVGWTAEAFGERIGVTRQTINNIEAGRNKLTKTQYIAMRSVLDAEINQHPDETEMLRLLLDVLVDSPEKYSSDEIKELVSKANLMSPSILAGTTSRAEVSKEWMKIACGLAGVAAAMSFIPFGGGTVAGGWLTKVLAMAKKRNK